MSVSSPLTVVDMQTEKGKLTVMSIRADELPSQTCFCLCLWGPSFCRGT